MGRPGSAPIGYFMGGRRIISLVDCIIHGAALEITCTACEHRAFFNPSNLRDALGIWDCEPDQLRFRCRCGSRRFRWAARFGVPYSQRQMLPTPRPRTAF